jgi:hypothetical protein
MADAEDSLPPSTTTPAYILLDPNPTKRLFALNPSQPVALSSYNMSSTPLLPLPPPPPHAATFLSIV